MDPPISNLGIMKMWPYEFFILKLAIVEFLFANNLEFAIDDQVYIDRLHALVVNVLALLVGLLSRTINEFGSLHLRHPG